MIGLVLPLLAGFGGVQAVRLLGDSMSVAERWGLGLLIGLGSVTGALALLGIAGVPLSAGTAFGTAIGGVALGSWIGRRSPFPVPRLRLDAASAVVAAALLVLVVVAAIRADFYPVSAMDAHAYDGRARRIIAEESLRPARLSSPAIDGRSNRSYPPLYPLSLALVEWSGGAEGKLVDSVWLVALLLVAGGFVARRSGSTLAGFVTAFLIAAAPEFWRHASLGLTNLSTTAAIGSATLLSAERMAPGAKGSSRPHFSFFLPGFLFAIGTGLRIESVVVAASVGLVLLLRRQPIAAALLTSPSVVVAAGWQMVLHAWFGTTNGAALRASLAPDPALIARTLAAVGAALVEPGLYGWCFAVAAVGLVTFFLFRRDRHDRLVPILAILLLAEGVALVGIYQQIDPSFGGGTGSYFVHSLKRALFVLLPLAAALGVVPLATPRRVAP